MTDPEPGEEPLLERLDRVRALAEEVGSEVLGPRVRRWRDLQGLSIRELAERAGLSKNSIVRLEQGRGSQALTLLRVCTVLGVHVERLAGSGGDMLVAAAHHGADDRWFDGSDMGSGPLLGEDRPLTGLERQRAVTSGARLPVNLLTCRLPGGRVLPSIMEVHAPTEPKSHVGEEFVYVLEGELQLTVGDELHSLAAGESVTFFSAEPHSYAPADPKQTPVRVLSVRVEG